MAEVEPKFETVALEVPARILKDLRSLVDTGLYLSLEEALRESLLTNWRFLRASYHRIRVDLSDPAADEDQESPHDA
jgi:Arc/MetJ-type ribon-helix-helix transcriptional regulator